MPACRPAQGRPDRCRCARSIGPPPAPSCHAHMIRSSDARASSLFPKPWYPEPVLSHPGHRMPSAWKYVHSKVLTCGSCSPFEATPSSALLCPTRRCGGGRSGWLFDGSGFQTVAGGVPVLSMCMIHGQVHASSLHVARLGLLLCHMSESQVFVT